VRAVDLVPAGDETQAPAAPPPDASASPE
jgi:hypothetical protein